MHDERYDYNFKDFRSGIKSENVLIASAATVKKKCPLRDIYNSDLLDFTYVACFITGELEKICAFWQLLLSKSLRICIRQNYTYQIPSYVFESKNECPVNFELEKQPNMGVRCRNTAFSYMYN